MGYGFIGYHRKTDDKSIFYTSCMYAYQPIFKECFGKEITEFRGRVTKSKIDEFKNGVTNLERHPDGIKYDRK